MPNQVAEPHAPPPENVRAYISDLLGELADMADRHGDRRLARAIRLLALEAATADGGSTVG